MGIYDSVYFDCPKCGAVVEAQSKAGKCTLDTFGSASVPPIIARDIENDSVRCDNCGTVSRVVRIERVPMVEMELKEL